MASAVENFTFNELPRRLVVDSSLPTGSSLTAGWVLVASGLGFQAIPTDPVTLGFEPTVAPATGDPTTQYYRGDKTWQTLDAGAVGAIAASEKGVALGVATLDADGYVSLSQMNPSVIERVVIVADEAARYALTTLDVQNGDVVNQQSPLPATMWFVVDQDNLGNSGGYLPFSAGIAGSVAWSGVTGKPAIIGDLENISLAAEGDLIQFVSGNWVKVNAATLKTSLSIQTSDVSGLDTALGNLQPKGNNLTAVTDLATDGIMVMTNAGTGLAAVQSREITTAAPLNITDGNGVNDNPYIYLDESGVAAGTYGDDLNYPVIEVTSEGLLVDASVQPIERPSLIIPNSTADYQLSNRTRHILGMAGTYGALSLILPVGNTLQAGSWVEIVVNEDLIEFTDTVVISSTETQSVNNVSSINLVSYGLYPGSRIYCVYEHLSSEWVVTVNNNNTFRSLTIVNPASTDFTEAHLIESAALQPRTVFLPDADVDLTKVSQAASSSEDGYLTSTDWNTFNNKQAALANVITAGTYGSATQYPVITYNAKGIATDVTLQDVPTPDIVLNVVTANTTVSAVANKNHLIEATSAFTLNADLLSAGYGITIKCATVSSMLVTFTSGIGRTFLGSNGGVITSTTLQLGQSVNLVLVGSGVRVMPSYQIASSNFRLLQNPADGTGLSFNLTGLSSVSYTWTVPPANINFGNVLMSLGTNWGFGFSNTAVPSMTYTNPNGTLQTVSLKEIAYAQEYLDGSVTSTTVIGTRATTKFTIGNAGGGVHTFDLTALAVPYSFRVVNATINAGRSIILTKTGASFSEGSVSLGTSPCTIKLGFGESIEVTPSGTSTIVNVKRSYSNIISSDDRVASGYSSRFTAPAFTGNRTITVPDANVDLGKVAQAVTSSVDGYFTAADYLTLTKKVYITSTTGHVISGNDVNRDHEFILSSNANVNLQNLSLGRKALFRSGDGGTYTVTSTGAAQVGYDTSGPINVSLRRQITISGNNGGSHVGEVTNANMDASHFKLIGTGSASFNIPSGTSVITVPNYNVNLGSIPFLNDSAASPITMGGINYILIPPGSSGASVSIPITYLTTTVNTKFIVYNNTPTPGPLLANVTWAGQSAGFSGSITISYSDQSNLSPPREYLTGNPGVMSGASGSTLVKIGNIPAYGSVEVIVIGNQSSSIALGINISSANGGLGANNQNLKIYKSLSDFAKYMYVDAAALTTARGLTLPDANVNLGTLSSVATTDGNVLSGTRTRIVGGSGNTVSGTDNIVIGGGSNGLSGSGAVAINSNLVGITNNQVVVINARSPNATAPERNSILLGTSTQTDLFKNKGTAAALRLNALYTLSSTIPVSGTLYATVDGSQTLSVSNLVLGVNDTASCAAHEVEFIVCAGVATGFGGVLPTGYFIAKRRIVAYKAAPSGTFFISAVQTIGTDITLGTLDGTITPNLSVDTTIGSDTINRLLCTITRTGGVAGQEVVAMSVRVASHHST